MLAQAASSPSRGSQTRPAARITYTREALLLHRNDVTFAPARHIRRALWFFGLLRHSSFYAQPHVSSEITPPIDGQYSRETRTHTNCRVFYNSRFRQRAALERNGDGPSVAGAAQGARRRPNRSRLRLLSANIRGLHSNLISLQAALPVYDVVCLGETFLRADSSVNFTGFSFFRKDRGSHGGGVAVLVREEIGALPLVVPNVAHADLEAIWLRVPALISRRSCIIGTVYRPPNSSAVAFFDALESTVSAVRSAHPMTDLIICGDTNSHQQEWGDSTTDTAGRAALAFCVNTGLTQTVRDSTLIARSNGCSVIDHFFTDLPDHVICTRTVPGLGSSDHCGVAVTIISPPCRDRPHTRIFLQYDRADWSGLRLFFCETDWPSVLRGSVDEVWRKWREVVLEGVSTFIPSKSVKLRPNSAPWFGLTCARARDKKLAAWKLWRRDPGPAALRSYRQACSDARRTYADARRTYFHSVALGLEGAPADPKQFWRAINAALGRLKGSSIPTLLHEGHVLTTSRAKAETLNRVFAAKAAIEDNGRQPPTLENVTEAELHHVNFESYEVYRLLQHLQVNKATGPDDISARVLRECAAELAPSLSQFFRMSLRAGRVPAGWKHGRITACHKGGPKDNPMNYRPISLLPIASKVMETIINQRLRHFLNTNGLLPDSQFGFRPNLSTLDMTVSLTQRWSDALDRGQEARVVSLDLSRAFDRVWHRGLIAKLTACGIGGCLHEWLADFLRDRSQTVVVRGQESTAVTVRAGVPQGSVLGPTLFLVFVRDMADDIKSDLAFYADDSTLHRIIPSKSDRATAADILNADLRALQLWAETWCAKFNAAKTQVLTISRARDASCGHPPLSLANQRLEEVGNLLLVGLHINPRLSWGHHVRKLATRCSQQLGALRRASFCLPQSALVAAYKGTIRARIEHLSPVWCGAPQTDLRLLHRLQDRALRLCGLDNSATSSLMSLRIQPLEVRWRTSTLALLHRATTGAAPPPVSDLLPDLVEWRRSTRASEAAHNRALQMPRSRTAHHACSFLPRATRQWNALPADAFLGGDPTKELQFLKIFASKLPYT